MYHLSLCVRGIFSDFTLVLVVLQKALLLHLNPLQ